MRRLFLCASARFLITSNPGQKVTPVLTSGLLGDDFHAFADGLYRTLSGIHILFGKEFVETL